MARRSFGDAVNDPQTGVSRHPEDYQLYQVGVFDDNAGTFDKFVSPEFLANAVDFVPVKQDFKSEVKDEKDSR